MLQFAKLELKQGFRICLREGTGEFIVKFHGLQIYEIRPLASVVRSMRGLQGVPERLIQ